MHIICAKWLPNEISSSLMNCNSNKKQNNPHRNAYSCICTQIHTHAHICKCMEIFCKVTFALKSC